ncbi:MAG TPA: hypothetical protein VD997_02570 [Phycisphaerales bacterium]|nr:hypothetical protein [Phycisphaerales bacterium]
MLSKVRVVGLLALVAGASTLGGCASSVDGDLSPGLATLSGRAVDYGNSRAHAWDTNYRTLKEDWARGFAFTDRPSRLSPAPIPH